MTGIATIALPSPRIANENRLVAPVASPAAPAATLYPSACAQRLPQLDQWLAAHAGERLLYVNPPRTGLEAEVLTWIIDTLRPRMMGYMSCSAGTLRRDLQALTAAGYTVVQLVPYDFFPQTYHVETLALLQSC